MSYNEYLERVNWGPSERMHRWVARRTMKEFLRVEGLSASDLNLMEIGTGSGRIASASQQLGFASYLGIEPTRDLAMFARETMGLDILEESLPNLTNIGNDSHDIVVSLHVLEHAASYADARDWCAEMLRVVRPGGYVLVVTPDLHDWKTFFWSADWSHGWPTTPQRISQVFNDLDAPICFSGSLHIGSLRLFPAVVAHALSFLIPTRLVDAITFRIVGRPLGSGFKQGLLWGMSFVVVTKR